VDDQLPFVDNDPSADETQSDKYTALYPQTATPGEIWPALLMKALLKVTSLE